MLRYSQHVVKEELIYMTVQHMSPTMHKNYSYVMLSPFDKSIAFLAYK